MTLSTTNSQVVYIGNATTVSFAFPYIFFAPTDLVVTLYDTVAMAPVNPQPVLNGSGTYDYAVSGTQDPNSGEYLSGAAIIFNNAPPANYQITLSRSVPLTQQTSFSNNSLFPAKAVEAALDRLTCIAQQIAQNAALTVIGNNSQTNGAVGYSVNRLFAPAIIDQWQILLNLPAGKTGTGTMNIYLPTNFPTGAEVFLANVDYTPAPGFTPLWNLGPGDSKTYVTITWSGFAQNSTFNLELVTKGY